MAMPAAARVFAIPELLEEILIHTGLADVPPPTDNVFPEPSLALFRLQRVNTAFQDTIQNSKSLKQLMFLARVDCSDAARVLLPHHAPLMWLLQAMGLQQHVSNYTRYHQGVDEIFIPCHISGRYQMFTDIGAFELFKKRFGYANASWREIKTTNAKLDSKIKVRMEIQMKESRFSTSGAPPPDYWHYIRWVFDTKHRVYTLGEVFERFVCFLRTLDKHKNGSLEAKDAAKAFNAL